MGSSQCQIETGNAIQAHGAVKELGLSFPHQSVELQWSEVELDVYGTALKEATVRPNTLMQARTEGWPRDQRVWAKGQKFVPEQEDTGQGRTQY